MPYITEEVYQSYDFNKERSKSIHLSSWPKYQKEFYNKKAEEVGDLAISIIKEVRQFKSKNNKSLKQEIDLTLEKETYKKINLVLDDLKAVTNSKKIDFSDKFEVKI